MEELLVVQVRGSIVGTGPVVRVRDGIGNTGTRPPNNKEPMIGFTKGEKNAVK
jgi:hypothetical protein